MVTVGPHKLPIWTAGPRGGRWCRIHGQKHTSRNEPAMDETEQRGTKRGRPTGGCPEPVSVKQLGPPPTPPPPPPTADRRPPNPPRRRLHCRCRRQDQGARSSGSQSGLERHVARASDARGGQGRHDHRCVPGGHRQAVPRGAGLDRRHAVVPRQRRRQQD